MQTNPGPRIKILTAVLLGIQAFWNVTLCCWAKDSWRFKGSCYLHLQGSRPAAQEKFFPDCL